MAAKQIAWWQRWGNFAQIASALIAAFGFGAILLQVNELRSNNRAASARQVYLAYMDLEFRNPQFAAPDYERIKSGDKDTRTRYESFVSTLLYACEEALAAFAGQREWINSCETDLKVHLPMLCENKAADSAFLASFSDSTQAFVQTLLNRSRIIGPECKPGKL
jgi:hypothetical protein